MGLVPDIWDKVSSNPFVGGWSCLQFVKITSVKRDKETRNKKRYSYIWSYGFFEETISYEFISHCYID